MTDKDSDDHTVTAGPVHFNFDIDLKVGGVTVVRADGIEAEDSPTYKWLRLRTGDIELPNRVFLVIDGNRYEITRDSLPEEDDPPT